MPDTIIVVPCYNESDRFAADCFVAFAAEQAAVRFLFVDDGSSDSTPEVLRKLESRDPHRFALRELPRNRGKAEAVRQGMLAALERDPTYAGYWDADLATPLEAIPSFVELLDERPDLEMVFGSRVKLLGRMIERSALRHYPGRVLATLSSFALGLGVYDTQCGAKLFRASPEIGALFAEPFTANWMFDVEVLARLIRARRGSGRGAPEQVIHEFALQEWRDVVGSKVRPWDFFRAIFEIVRIRRRYLSGGGLARPTR
jgi:glycosyltransferase involved in cell wall biosynthesis